MDMDMGWITSTYDMGMNIGCMFIDDLVVL